MFVLFALCNGRQSRIKYAWDSRVGHGLVKGLLMGHATS
jgi:hypothetical protein